MKALFISGFVLFLLSASAYAKTPTISLQCGSIPNFKTQAERQYLDAASGGGDTYNINLTIIGKKPSNNILDKALRECLDEAIKKDGNKDILASAWFRRKEGDNSNDDDLLNPYGANKYISYTASTKKIAIHSIGHH